MITNLNFKKKNKVNFKTISGGDEIVSGYNIDYY